MQRIGIIGGTLSVVLLLSSILFFNAQNESNMSMLTENAKSSDELIVNTAFFYIKDGEEARFEKLRSRGNVLLEKYGARIERVIKPTMLAAGELELPDEIHFAVYPNAAAKAAFDADPEFLQLKQEYLAGAVDKMFGFATHLDNFEFFREIGDATKTYGVALIYFKEGQEHAEQFAQYHEAACAIIPEFGSHFERFLIPFAAANELKEQPDEIHRFYFDSQEGMQQMVTDQRMQALFPQRDGSLKELVFILGDAIQ